MWVTEKPSIKNQMEVHHNDQLSYILMTIITMNPTQKRVGEFKPLLSKALAGTHMIVTNIIHYIYTD